MSRFPALVLALVLPLAAHAATFTVNSTGDAADANPGNGVCATSGGVCTLRAAIQEANALSGTDAIHFSIGSGPQTIAPATDLPAITDVLTIDGTTQPAIGFGPHILLDGGGLRGVGLDVSNVSVTVLGLAITGFTTAGIRTLQNGDTVTVDTCYIGVGLDGVTASGNGDGIFARIGDFGGSSLIVGDTTGGGNVISGNLDMGIEVTDNGPPGAKLGTFTVQGNTIGLGADGLTAVPNASGGIRTNLQFGTITIGGSAAARNIISGNRGGGYITAAFFQADVFVFSYNYVGVGADGVTQRGNRGTGASLVGAKYTVDQNIIAANTGHGVTFATGTQPSVMRGNRIGVALDGSAAGNTTDGILDSSASGLVIGGAGTDANIIANNGRTGIAVTGGGQAEIDENSIFANGGLGIDLGDDGVTANDPLDTDVQGGNDGQNYPTIVSAIRSGGITFINGSLSSAASSTYTLRFYASAAADPSGFGEGQTYLGSTSVTTNGSGSASFTFSAPGGSIGSVVSATATKSGETSEFSNALIVSAPPQFVWSASNTTTPESGSVALTIQRVNGASGAASVQWATTPGSAGTGDYTTSSGTANFADGQTTATVNIPITADTLDEDDESFSVVLSNPSAGTELGSPSTETVTITDDDAPPSVSIADATAAEGNVGNTPMGFNVTLSAPSGKVITVDYATTNGTATAGSDYAAAAGTLTFQPGETSKTITVQIVGDTAVETNETFNVALSNPSNVTIADGSAIGTITNDDGQPSITIDDIAVVEGNSGTSTALFTVTLSGPSASTVTVQWSTSDGTATAGSDYQAGSGTLSFAPGETSKTIAVTIDGDTLVENNETFFVDLSGAVNATLADAQGGGTIVDDDGTPSLSVNDPAVVEGMPAVFTITLAPTSALPVTVDYATSDATADSSDYSGTSGTLTFAPGETTKTVTVATIDDAIAEPAEQFVLTLSAPSGATIAVPTGTATIIDNDGQPHVTIGDASAPEGNSGTVPLTFTIDLSHASETPIDVTWTTADGTAVAGSDYVANGGSITFAPGETSKSVTVVVSGDTVVEGDETFFVRLTGATNATITHDQGVGTIVNDDGSVSASIAGVSAPEGTGGTTNFAFTVSLSAPTSVPVTVQWATADGTAQSGSDYTAASGSITFAPGETSKSIDVSVNADSAFEADEMFFVNLLGATNATIGVAQATGTIINDDAAPAVPAVSIASASAFEGNAGTTLMTFAVTLDAPTTNSVTVQYATGGGTATAGSDYVAASGTITFAPGTTAQSISVAVIGDTMIEGNETFDVTLSAPLNAVLGTATAAGTIIDDDVAAAIPSISIAGASIAEGNSGSVMLMFPVTLSVPTTATVTVNYATSDGTATGGADYASASGTLIFPPGTTTQSIAVPILGDTLVEGNETFTVALAAPSNAVLGTASATGTILDDDTAPVLPSISIGDVAQLEGNAGVTLFRFPVTLSAPATATVTVAWTTLAGTATAGSDFTASSGTIAFAPGVTAQTISIAVNGDTTVENDESFSVQLSDPVNATIADGTGTGTIRNDDAAAPRLPDVSAAGTSIVEGDDGVKTATVTLTLSAPAPGGSIRWMTRGETATAGSDFVEGSGQITFGSGNTATIDVQIIGDRIAESDETLAVDLFDPQGVTLRDQSATITIVDDDATPKTQAIVLAVGSLQGAAGSHFATAAQMVNFSDAPASGSLIVHPAGATDSARDVAIPYALGPGELRAFGDLLAENGLEGLATLDVVPSSGAVPRMIVRIYDDGSGHGTTGFTLPVVTPSDALVAGDNGLLVPPDDPIAMRFNVGIRTLADGATMTIEVRGRSGETRRSATREFAPNWFNQMTVTDFAQGSLEPGDYLVIHVTRGSAILYGASVDNVSNDPSVQLVTK